MSQPTANVHDAFFKQIMTDPQTAGRFLRERLPAEVAALLADNPPELVPGSFVDEDLAQHHSDLLYRTRLADGGGEALVYVLVEHKSAPDPLVGLQLLRYLARFWDAWERQGNQRPVPPVIPVVVYHGARAWTVPTSFAALFGDVPAALCRHLPAFEFALIDLGRIEDEALSADLRLRAFLKALKYILRPDLPERIDVVLAEAAVLDILDVVVVLTYIDRGQSRVVREAVLNALRRLPAARQEEIMRSITQPEYDEGLAKGLAQGKVEGKTEALTGLLVRRFGPLSDEIRSRIAGADYETLSKWFDQAIDAPDLDAVFGGQQRH